MRISVDLSPLLVRSAGVKTYLYHWYRALRSAGMHTLSSFPTLLRNEPLLHEGSVFGGARTLFGLARLSAFNRLPELAADRLAPTSDLFHVSNLIHWFPKTPLCTTTLHDVTTWTFPSLHTAGNIRADRIFAETILRHCDGVICVSEATRQDAIRHLGLPESRSRAIHSGVPQRYFDAKLTAEVRERYRLTKPFLLFTGSIEPRKNVDLLLDAYLDLPRDVRDHWELVVTGPPGWQCEATVARLHSSGNDVRYLGYTPEGDLPSILAAASAFVYPSLYEGFGFPVVQAMAAGVPVVTSNVPALAEVSGGATHLIDPKSQADLRSALLTVTTQPDYRQELAVKGRARAEIFRWERCARESLSYFESLAGRA
jgi:alpha-1,3-rhamnosyl/mannosyltransferase